MNIAIPVNDNNMEAQVNQYLGRSPYFLINSDPHTRDFSHELGSVFLYICH